MLRYSPITTKFVSSPFIAITLCYIELYTQVPLIEPQCVRGQGAGGC